MFSVFIHPFEPFLEIYYMEGRDMEGGNGGYEKEKARVLYDFRDRLKVPALAPEEKAHIGF